MRFVCIILLMVCQSALADEIEIGTNHSIDIGEDFDVFVDPFHKVTIEELISESAAWEPAEPEDIRPGFLKATVWQKMQLRNVADQPRSFLLSYLFLDIDVAEFFVVRDGVVTNSGVSGRNLPSDTWQLQYNHIGYEFSVDAGESIVLIAKIRTSSPVSLDAYVQDIGGVIPELTYEALLYGVYFGCFLVLFIFNMFMYFQVRESVYLVYSLFISTMFLNIFIRMNYWDLYLAPLGFPKGSLLVSIGMFLPAITAAMFTRSFLETRVTLPKVDRVLLLMIVGGTGLAGVSIVLSRTQNIEPLIRVVVAAYSFSFIGVGIIAKLKRIPGAGYFLSAWSVLLGAVLLWLAHQQGILPDWNLGRNQIAYGQVAEMIILSIGVTSRLKRVNEARVLNEKRALDRDRMRDMLRVVTHDLANPLNVANISMQMLTKDLEKLEAPGLVRNASRAYMSIGTMVDQVRQIQNYISMESGKSQIALGEVSLARFEEWFDFMFTERIQEKDLSLEITGDSVENLLVIADERILFNTVFANIISNAIKFSHAGDKIVVSFAAEKDTVEVVVKDFGIGIPEELLGIVFDVDTPTSREGTANESGSGFGLPLVKGFMDKMKGSISITSRVQEEGFESTGTEVKLTFKRVTAKLTDLTNAA